MVADTARETVVPRLAGRSDEDAGRIARTAGVSVGCELGGGGTRLDSWPVELLLNVQAGGAGSHGTCGLVVNQW